MGVGCGLRFLFMNRFRYCLLLLVGWSVLSAGWLLAQSSNSSKTSPPKKEGASSSPARPPARNAWKVIDYRGQAYLDIADVAAFFDFKTVNRSGRSVVLEKEKIVDGKRFVTEFRATEGSKLITLNRLQFYMSYPLVKWRDGKLIISAFDVIHLIDPILRPEQAREPTKLTTVILDPARGGSEAGVTTKHGKEKEVTLDVARRLKPMLESAGFRVVMTREDDSLISVPERLRLANEVEGESILVSLHCGYGNEREKGVEMFTLSPCGTPSTTGDEGRPPDTKFYPGNINDRESMALATALQGRLVTRLNTADLGIRRARFEELKRAHMPAVVCRLGRLAHPEEGRQLGSDAAYRQKVAASLAEGLGVYAKVMEMGSAPQEKLLKFSRVMTEWGEPSADGEQVVHVRALIAKTDKAAQIDPSQITLQIFFLDFVNGEEIDLSACDTPVVEWVSAIPDWKTALYEEVKFTYHQPAPTEGTLRSLGRRVYYGFVLRLVYGDELMDEYSEPPNVRRGLGNFTPLLPRRR